MIWGGVWGRWCSPGKVIARRSGFRVRRRWGRQVHEPRHWEGGGRQVAIVTELVAMLWRELLLGAVTAVVRGRGVCHEMHGL